MACVYERVQDAGCRVHATMALYAQPGRRGNRGYIGLSARFSIYPRNRSRAFSLSLVFPLSLFPPTPYHPLFRSLFTTRVVRNRTNIREIPGTGQDSARQGWLASKSYCRSDSESECTAREIESYPY